MEFLAILMKTRKLMIIINYFMRFLKRNFANKNRLNVFWNLLWLVIGLKLSTKEFVYELDACWSQQESISSERPIRFSYLNLVFAYTSRMTRKYLQSALVTNARFNNFRPKPITKSALTHASNLKLCNTTITWPNFPNSNPI